MTSHWSTYHLTTFLMVLNKIPTLKMKPFSPLSVYGASKAAGDLLAATTLKHYILRTSWVIGEGKKLC
jgi:nucleoside-diphosphate-sugar epimerase